MGRTLCLCAVRDPANLGAIVRSAAAFGVKSLLLSADCADVYHPKTLRAAMGNLFRLSVYIVEDLPASLQTLKAAGRRVFAAELRPGALPLLSLPVRQEDVFIIGNEGHGLSAAVLNAADERVFIPMSGRAESLNAAVAASVLMWEFAKKTGRRT